MRRTEPALDCELCPRLQEAEHRIANHLWMLSGIARLKALALASETGNGGREEAVLALEQIRMHLHAVSRLHRTLSVGSASTMMDVAEYLDTLCESLPPWEGDTLTLTLDVAPGCRLPADRMLVAAQILTEAVTNACKHGTSDGGHVLLRCGDDGNGTVSFEVIDHGPGFPEDFDPNTSSSFGMILIRRLAESVAGTIHFRSSAAGVIFRLDIPSSGSIPSATRDLGGP